MLPTARKLDDRIPRSKAIWCLLLKRGERGIWQRRFWEQIRDERDLHKHIDYIPINPVKHGHVRRAIDWPYSSIHRFVRDARCDPGWAAEPFVLEMERE